YINNTGKNQPAVFTFTKGDIWKNNLESKKVRCKKFFINNKALPLFIPERVTDSSFFNVTDTRVTTFHQINNSLTPTSLKYYIIVRNQNNSESCIVYLRQPQLNPQLQAPAFVITDDYDYYTNLYFYYYNLQEWLEEIANSINQCNSVLQGPNINAV